MDRKNIKMVGWIFKKCMDQKKNGWMVGWMDGWLDG